MATMQEIETWRGRTLYDRDGDKIGTIEDVYLDRNSGDPEWLAVKTGLFGSNVSFVPIRDAAAHGDDVRVQHEKDLVKDAPNVEADGQLSPEEERRLYQHYGRSDYDEWTDTSEDRTEALFGRDESDRFAAGRTGDGDRDLDSEGDARGTVGHDTSGPTTDDAMTRSEEEVDIGTQRRETGRARLRKYVTTENVERTVPVQREDVRVDREPITDANRDAALDGPEISEEEHEVTLHTEEPVVEKRAVPKERVRLDKEVHTDEETVSEEVRKEHIEAEGAAKDRL
ncbi:MAG TPA: PRC and DUF2382 domain-containing protein [Solirubrobacteraceae bacterium]|nr:PRC and DUF2382 domain-containing protein [Solirubrobacteraceae bacterium]